MIDLRLPILVALCASTIACSSSPKKYVWDGRNSTIGGLASSNSSPSRRLIYNVKTTAYTHTEADHIPFGAKNALGTDLKYGAMRSAAADWSVYPVGTVFKIQGEPHVYQVDDYGSALVGTRTIDLYRPSTEAMNGWGARNVNIDVIHWGSFTQSFNLMKNSKDKSHVNQMMSEIVNRTGPKA
ncbi:MAG: 3d domain [Verrucomicrobiaceae bacterium]|nr:3d domain [Verrucomicrobiaceae bacterium]